VTQYRLSDGLNSSSKMADGTGNVIATYDYDVTVSIHTQAGSSDNPLLFMGEQRDAESGLVAPSGPRMVFP
jgi:hypothetical protein